MPSDNLNAVDNIATGVDERAINTFRFGETEDHLVMAYIILPTKLNYFNLQMSNCTSHLDWSSAVEENFSRYEVERSTDGKQYSNIGQVAGRGSNNRYYFEDEQTPTAGNVYYRLKMVDRDGRVNYSAVKLISNKCNTVISATPTITSGLTTVSGLKTGELVNVYNMAGQMVLKLRAGSQSEKIDLSNLPAGAYRIIVSQYGKLLHATTIIKQ